ncbi:toxin-antitoxin system YwqK family antitoxin [Hahella sp. KA22]|uniref:toxin-antitoxin system YwqK family antitoxin n=1 Tax=Hahella sp. KA22 TaxID=1628392 RepID=UPI0013E2D70B|nr:hypothetical protein [Hahella sp. KA22]
MSQIDESLLEFNDDDLLVFEGKPYTGETFLNYAGGNIKRAMSYDNGLPSGCCKEWYESGQLKREWLAVRSQGASEEKQYYENGVTLSIRLTEHNIETSYEKYNESGELVEQRKLEANSPMAKVLERMRNVHA